VDVTSTKAKINQLAEKLDLKGADFIGGHPLFGSEKTGFAASKDIRAEGSTFCVVPGAKSSEISVHRLIRWLTELNLRVETAMSAEHDAILARTSHLVQLLTVLLGSQLCKGLTDEDLAKLGRLSGPSLKQMSRLMKSPSSMWKEIIELNKDQVLLALNETQRALVDLIDSLQKDGAQIDTLFESARRLPTALEKLENRQ
jgi:prephenate dehydrogenase